MKRPLKYQRKNLPQWKNQQGERLWDGNDFSYTVRNTENQLFWHVISKLFHWPESLPHLPHSDIHIIRTSRRDVVSQTLKES